MNRPPRDSTIINICIIPPKETGNICVDLSQSLESENTIFLLGKDRFAHMTVFMARFPNDLIDKVIQGVKKSLSGVSKFRCEHSGYFMSEGRYLEASYRKTPEFMVLHESLIQNISKYRINPGHPYEEGYFTPYTKQQRQNARETGYDLAHELYRPHITLTRYQESEVPLIFPALPAVALSFEVGKVCAYKADDNGAVYEHLTTFEV